MPYSINKYNGTLVAVVEDGTVDNTLDVSLIGRNYAGYGEVQNENMVHMLENFASASEPPRKITGQIWYDSGVKKIKFYDGDKFRTAGGSEVGNIKPSGLSIGDLWYKTDTNQLYSCSGNDNFVLIGPQAVQDAQTTELKSDKIDDVNGDPHPIIKGIIDGKIIFILSKTSFELPGAVPGELSEFSRIKKGITLADVDSLGISKKIGNDPNYVYWGTASNSVKLNGFIDTDFIKVTSPIFENRVRFLDAGFTVGNDNNLSVYVEDATDDLIVKNNIPDKRIFFKTTVNVIGGGTAEKTPIMLQGVSLLPGDATTSTIGTTNNTFKNIHAETFHGSLTGTASQADSLFDGTNYYVGSKSSTFNTVVIRDKDSSNKSTITADRFIGAVDAAITISGGAKGSLVYQTSTNLTGFLSVGSEKDILTVNGSGLPVWASLSTITNVGEASKVNVTNVIDPDADFFIPFTDTKDGMQQLKVHDDILAYNPRAKTLKAGTFSGISTTAKYADLAEKYLPDADYEVGTVLMIGGKKEVTAAQTGFRAIGVVSEKPAYLMNSELEDGVAVALKGRVPVKVNGSVVKGQRLVAAPNGTAQAFGNHNDAFAIALETNVEAGVKLVECIIL
jgi:hypothetical protein